MAPGRDAPETAGKSDIVLTTEGGGEACPELLTEILSLLLSLSLLHSLLHLLLSLLHLVVMVVVAHHPEIGQGLAVEPGQPAPFLDGEAQVLDGKDGLIQGGGRVDIFFFFLALPDL